jgi:mono/diheme cytochrome c family protein
MDCSPGDCENCSGCHGLTGKEANMLLTGHRARAAILIRERMQAEAGERLSVTNLVRLMKDWIRANLGNRVLNDAASVREWVQEVRRQLNRE